MKWAYLNKDDVVYLDVQGRVELYAPANPLRTLMLFKNPTFGDWIVADYKTGIKLKSCETRKAARQWFTDELCISVGSAFAAYAKRKKFFQEVNP